MTREVPTVPAGGDVGLSPCQAGENVDKVVAKLAELVHAGNVRRILVKDSEGTTIIEVPLTVGWSASRSFPVWAAIAAIAAIAADFTFQGEQKTEDPS